MILLLFGCGRERGGGKEYPSFLLASHGVLSVGIHLAKN